METPWMILSRILRVGPGPGDAAAGAEAAAAVGQEQHAAAAAAPDFTFKVVQPPWVSVLSAGSGAHPDSVNPDACPYIIAVGSHCLLAHFSAKPFSGMQLANGPMNSHLVVVRQFHTAEGQVRPWASAERIPDRIGGIPILRNIGNVALATNDGGDYMIAELQVDRGTDRAAIVFLRSTGHDGWAARRVTYPLAVHDDRDWTPNGAVYVDGALWWFDLSWGIISYDYDASLPEPSPNVDLTFHELPDARELAEATPHIETTRCVTASGNKLQYVEIITEGKAARVCMWTRSRNPDGDGWQWDARYAVRFHDIWDDDTYRVTGLPRKVPALAVVCPSEPNLVYFALEQYIFGVNVPEHRVVSHLADARVDMPFQPRPISGRFVVAGSTCYQCLSKIMQRCGRRGIQTLVSSKRLLHARSST